MSDKSSKGYQKTESYNEEIVADLAVHYKQILSLIGEDPNREGLLKTPERVAKALQYLTHGYDLDASEILKSAMFKEDYSQMV
ncbi:MAG: GTP cyclohydrolase I, partial [Oligoflexus sp.]|nr:GTP cyclohydrolase I [Pseudopedobacter sp.]